MAEWTGRAVAREGDENQADWFLRREAEWNGLTSHPAWGDYIGEVVRARDGVVNDLLRGVANRYGERGDDEKRAIIHTFNVILDMPIRVKRDADRAREAYAKMAEHRL